MRILIYVCIVFTCYACAKEDDIPQQSGSDSIYGTWELHQSAGGMTPFTSYPASNGMIISFDSTHIRFGRNGQTTYRDRYTVARDSFVDLQTCELLPPADNRPNRIVIESNPPTHRMSFVIEKGMLKIFSGCYAADGGWSLYKRITLSIPLTE